MPDYGPYDVVEDMSELYFALKKNNQKEVCLALANVQNALHEYISQTRIFTSQFHCREALEKYGRPRLLLWMGIE